MDRLTLKKLKVKVQDQFYAVPDFAFLGPNQCRKFEGNLAEASAEGASRSCGGGGDLWGFFSFFLLSFFEI